MLSDLDLPLMLFGNALMDRKEITMNLTEKPETVTWPSTHYICIEKIGEFMETAPLSWTTLHQLIPTISESNTITGYLSLFKIEQKIYQAAVSVAEPAKNLPVGTDYRMFAGGTYNKFVLTGSFSELPKAISRVIELVDESAIQTADNFWIEHYITDPRVVPEDQNIIEILVPTE
jgi:effector-binding domain-containing protein